MVCLKVSKYDVVVDLSQYEKCVASMLVTLNPLTINVPIIWINFPSYTFAEKMAGAYMMGTLVVKGSNYRFIVFLHKLI